MLVGHQRDIGLRPYLCQTNQPMIFAGQMTAVPNLVKRWEAVYSSDEEGEAGGAETQAVRIEKYFFFEIQEFYIFLRW